MTNHHWPPPQATSSPAAGTQTGASHQLLRLIQINDRVHRAIADRNPAQGYGWPLSPRLAVIIPLVAVLSQVYVPRFIPFLAYLEVATAHHHVHFALSSGGPIPALFYGMFIGLVQDSLSHQPIGMYGIVKTLVGYFAASVGMRFDVQNPVVTFILAFFFYFFHQFFYW